MRLKHNEKHSNILAIKSPHHTLTEPGEINSAFKAFCSTLYKSEVTLDPNTCKNFFRGLDLPSLSRQEAKGLNSPISLEELREALVNIKKGKSSGWDSIPPELYIVFWDILGQPLLDMITTAINEGAFSLGANTAIITVLPKPNKDPSQCSNYRPISLLNGDVSVLRFLLHA